jgi:hypothetical protein
MVGTESVCDWYGNMASDEAPYYSVWAKSPKVLKFSFDGDSKEDGLTMLRSNLAPAELNGMDNVLVIRLHKHLDPKQGITDRSSYWASTDFRLNPLEEFSADMGYMAGGASLAAINARLKALETGGLEEAPRGIMGTIQGLIESEPIQNVLAGVLAGIASKFLPSMPGQATPQLAINGIKDEGVSPETYQALLSLESVDPTIEDDLQLLARLAKENPAMFNTLLTTLRSMYGKA